MIWAALRRRWWAWRLRRLERRIDSACFDAALSLKLDQLQARVEAEGKVKP